MLTVWLCCDEKILASSRTFWASARLRATSNHVPGESCLLLKSAVRIPIALYLGSPGPSPELPFRFLPLSRGNPSRAEPSIRPKKAAVRQYGMSSM